MLGSDRFHYSSNLFCLGNIWSHKRTWLPWRYSCWWHINGRWTMYSR